jgi:hypothetical protein
MRIDARWEGERAVSAASLASGIPFYNFRLTDGARWSHVGQALGFAVLWLRGREIIG